MADPAGWDVRVNELTFRLRNEATAENVRALLTQAAIAVIESADIHVRPLTDRELEEEPPPDGPVYRA